MSLEVPSATPPSSRSDEVIPITYVIIGVTVVLVLGIALILSIVFLARNYPAEIEAIRDVFIIALALESCLFGVVLMLMLIMLIRLVNTVEFEIKPILEQTNETMATIRGTSAFVSKNVVQPVSKATGSPRSESAVRQPEKESTGLVKSDLNWLVT
jgi:hypothetical protein